jgi:hypothetical protein
MLLGIENQDRKAKETEDYQDFNLTAIKDSQDAVRR